MAWTTCLNEFREIWLPHMTDAAVERVSELLESGSPLLIHGMFTQDMPRGCIATHIGWHHPRTEHLSMDAGIHWLTKVAGLNPATSQVILAWDAHGLTDWDLRQELAAACREEKTRRLGRPANRVLPYLQAVAA